MLIYGQDEQLAAWIGEQLQVTFLPPYACIGIVRGDELIGASLYNNFMWPDIQWSFASTSPRWASRQVIGRLFAYPFLELKCLRLSAVTRSANLSARSSLRRLGFAQEGHHPQLYADDDGVSYGLMRDHAMKWIEVRNESPDSTDSTDPNPARRAGC